VLLLQRLGELVLSAHAVLLDLFFFLLKKPKASLFKVNSYSNCQTILEEM